MGTNGRWTSLALIAAALTCGRVAEAGVVLISSNRETDVGSYVNYRPGQQPVGTPVTQSTFTPTVAPDFSPFSNGSQTSSFDLSSGGLKLSVAGSGRLSVSAKNSNTYLLAEQYVVSTATVTFQVTDHAENYTFHADGLDGAIAAITGVRTLATVVLSFGALVGPFDATGTLQPGTYTYDLHTTTYDPNGQQGAARISGQNDLAGFQGATFAVTPEPGIGLGVGTLLLATRRRRR